MNENMIVKLVAVGLLAFAVGAVGASEWQPDEEPACECQLVQSDGNITFIFCDATDSFDGERNRVIIENRSVESGNVTLEGLNE